MSVQKTNDNKFLMVTKMNKKKIRVLNSGGVYCEIFIDDELSYKNQSKAGRQYKLYRLSR